MKGLILLISILIFQIQAPSFALEEITLDLDQSNKASRENALPELKMAEPSLIPFSKCTKYFKLNSQDIFYLALSAINTNNHEIVEIQSKSGYIIFATKDKKFLLTVITIDKNNSLIKITPCDNNYYFSYDIVKKLFNYINLNITEKPQNLKIIK